QSLNNLAGALRAQGELAKAEPLYREAVAMRRALYPKGKFPHGHKDLAATLNNLGSLLSAQGEQAQAERCYREALAMRQALYPMAQYPEGHVDLAHSFAALGLLLQARGEFAQAEPYYRDAVRMYTRLARRLAQAAPEPVALNAAATFPLARDWLLSVTASPA